MKESTSNEKNLSGIRNDNVNNGGEEFDILDVVRERTSASSSCTRPAAIVTMNGDMEKEIEKQRAMELGPAVGKSLNSNGQTRAKERSISAAAAAAAAGSATAATTRMCCTGDDGSTTMATQKEENTIHAEESKMASGSGLPHKNGSSYANSAPEEVLDTLDVVRERQLKTDSSSLGIRYQKEMEKQKKNTKSHSNNKPTSNDVAGGAERLDTNKKMINKEQQNHIVAEEFDVMDAVLKRAALITNEESNDVVEVTTEPPQQSSEGKRTINSISSQPGAYSGAPGEGLQRRDDMRFSLVGVLGDKVLSKAVLEDKTSEKEDTRNLERTNQKESMLTNTDQSAGLSEAFPVHDDDCIAPDVEAQPFDVGEAEKRKSTVERSYRAKLCLMAIIILVVVAAILGWVLKNTKKETQPSFTSAPTSYRSTLLAEFEAKIQKTFGDDYLDEENDLFEVRMLALYWILNEDPMQLESNADNLVQRYILAVFYFRTSQENEWIRCGAGGPDLCYYKIFMHESTTPGYSWLSEHHECFWATITCDKNKTVEQIMMFDNGLHGSIPTELAGLTQLRDLYLPGNNLTGSIPTELAELTTLEEIDLVRNQLGGEINWMVFEPLHNLRGLWLNDNLFTGSISSDIQFYSGNRLTVDRNDLTGLFPPEFYSLSNLIWWSGSGNRITGTIATDISRMVNLTHIHLRNTLISGTIPSEIGLLENLDGIDVSGSNMGGSLPEDLFTSVAPLTKIDVSNCAFSGTISTNIGLHNRLTALNLADNNFDGTIPSEISALSELKFFHVNGNHFTGIFPKSVCANSYQSSFINARKYVADCLPDEDTNIVAMECQCCTECCSPTTRICLEV